MTAAKVLGVILGFIALVLTYNALNPYVFALIALIGGLAAAVIVYLVTVRIVQELIH